ncbi:MAG: Asp-tRNA(Asn)/Glu-tRNA(Gln) amidotransferase GatCAB subunit A [Acidobacteria bacterium]|nr:Asp-tRNA(Asn)/Glu-tRNA(Gln) amidotransferase GatCAB subunit A [Acidobacteriota bacterium]
MATIGELCAKTLTEVAALIKKKEISPVELTQAMLERISAHDGKLHSFLTVASDLALQQAQAAEREIAKGHYRGPLHGIPIAVKDLIYTKDVRTTCASKIFADWTPEYDATAMTKLYSAGAVLLGKLSMTEFAGIGYHPTVPMPVNPWHPNHWAGSSSSGSGVATAASLCFGSLGTDTGGSIRFPSAACGIVGIKPTHGRVSRYGVFPLAESLDHVGPMTRTVADAATMLQVIAGFDPNDFTTRREPVPDYLAALDRGVKGLRIGLDRAFCSDGVDTEVSEAVLAATSVLRDLGASIQPMKFTHIEEAINAWGIIFTAECGAAHEATFPARADDYSAAFRAFLEAALQVRGVDYAKASVTRQAVRRMVDDLLQEVDLLLCPSMALAPMALDGRPVEEVVAPEVGHTLLRFTSPFSLTGNPTISVPCGFTSEGLPLSLQLIGRHGEEATVMRAGYAYEQATEWHNRRPPV